MDRQVFLACSAGSSTSSTKSVRADGEDVGECAPVVTRSIVEREVTHREGRRLTRLLELAQLKQRACLEDLDYRARPGLERSQVASLSSCDWIRAGQNLVIHGATGTGKTYLACALAHQACRQGLSALYVRAPRLFEELQLAHADGSFRKRLAAIAKTCVLVIDDFAIAPIGPRERTDLLELLDDRVGYYGDGILILLCL